MPQRHRFPVVLAVALACSQMPGVSATMEQPSAVAKKLIGHWRLVSFVNFTADGKERPGAYDSGRILYDEHGNMSAHLMRTGGKPLSQPATEAERAAAYGQYLGYSGRYTLDESIGKVTHAVEGSSNPNWIKTELVRYYAFSPDGNRLMLSIRSGDRVTGTLTWERLK
jgi:hypothetical protein